MLDEIRFSGPGDAPTAFETRLLTTCTGDSPITQFAARVASAFGPETAAIITCLLLDELGNERIDVPRRQAFFRALWCRDRDRLIVHLASPGQGYLKSEIADMLGVHKSHVSRVVAGKQKRRTGNRRHGKTRP